jgi:predicted nucleic-acid-binding protein
MPKAEMPMTEVKTTPSQNPFEQRTIEIYKKGSIPPSLFNKMASVLYPPTKWSRFTFSDKEMNDQLTAKIKSILSDASITYQPHKAEVPDMVISNHGEVLCKINFIHMDKPDSPGCIQMKKLKPEQTTCKAVQGVTAFFKSGEKQTQDRDSTKCFLHLIVFYRREKKEEYEKIKQVMEDFFKKTEKVTPMMERPLVERERPLVERKRPTFHRPPTVVRERPFRGGKRKSRSTQKRSSLRRKQKKKSTRRLRKRNML